MAWPSSVATNTELYLAVNNKATVLTANINDTVTSIPVVDTTGFPDDGFITIDGEIIYYTSKTGTSFDGATRGADGSIAASHLNNDTVHHYIIAAHHNILKNEIQALETDLFSAISTDLDDTAVAATTASDIAERLGQLANRIRAITGEAAWLDNPADTLNGISAELVAIQSDLDDAVTPNAVAADLKIRLNHIATQLKNITGETNWKTVPGIPLSGVLDLAGTRDMTGTLKMNSNFITGVLAGTTTNEAVNFGQLNNTLGAGKILQVVMGTPTTGSETTTNTSYFSTATQVSITPQRTDSKILIIAFGSLGQSDILNGVAYATLLRDGTNLESTGNGLCTVDSSIGSNQLRVPCTIGYLDSPATTSALSYTVGIKTNNASHTTTWGLGTQVIIALEVAV